VSVFCLYHFTDEPALLFRRNAFLTKEEEMEITDQSTLVILLLEARSNIQLGKLVALLPFE